MAFRNVAKTCKWFNHYKNYTEQNSRVNHGNSNFSTLPEFQNLTGKKATFAGPYGCLGKH